MVDEPTAELRRRLAGTPDPDLPDALWSKVEAGRASLLTRRARHRRVGGIAGLALAAVLLATSLPRPGEGPGMVHEGPGDAAGPVASRDDTRPSDPRQAGPARSIAGRDPLPPAVVQELRTLDRQLQAAYLDGADAQEIARLWRARDALVDAAALAEDPVRPFRI